MSGGSWDYFYRHIHDVADRLDVITETPLRRAFAAHLHLVAEALHDIEWVDSGDRSPDQEVDSIKKALGQSAITEELKPLLADFERVSSQLSECLKQVNK